LSQVLSSSETDRETHAEERRLVERLVRGDGDSWSDFVGRFGRIIRSRVADVARSFGCVRDEAAIDDATAEVFAVLVFNEAAALRAFEGRSSLSTYLAVIATRIATRGFASKRFTVIADDDVVHNKMPDDTVVEPIRTLIQNEQQLEVIALLNRLPEKQCKVIRLFHLEGHSYVQISEMLEMPIGSVGVTLRRGEAKLRGWMESGS
jgi:RNA polymerase sigma-70 factor (ECF subfamily)